MPTSFNLGDLHRRGIGMAPDPAAAARLYRRGCELGHQIACEWAADMAAD